MPDIEEMYISVIHAEDMPLDVVEFTNPPADGIKRFPTAQAMHDHGLHIISRQHARGVGLEDMHSFLGYASDSRGKAGQIMLPWRNPHERLMMCACVRNLLCSPELAADRYYLQVLAFLADGEGIEKPGITVIAVDKAGTCIVKGVYFEDGEMCIIEEVEGVPDSFIKMLDPAFQEEGVVGVHLMDKTINGVTTPLEPQN